MTCPTCGSKGFAPSLLGKDRCEFCDGTEGGVGPVSELAESKPTLNMYEEAIRQWGIDRNITPEGGATVMSQMSKMVSEFSEFLGTYNQLEEVCAAHDCSLEDLRKTLLSYTGSVCQEESWELYHRLEDDFGDMLVCIINAMRLAGTDAETCLAKAWSDIKDRKGTMVNGKFVKESP